MSIVYADAARLCAVKHDNAKGKTNIFSGHLASRYSPRRGTAQHYARKNAWVRHSPKANSITLIGDEWDQIPLRLALSPPAVVLRTRFPHPPRLCYFAHRLTILARCLSFIVLFLTRYPFMKKVFILRDECEAALFL